MTEKVKRLEDEEMVDLNFEAEEDEEEFVRISFSPREEFVEELLMEHVKERVVMTYRVSSKKMSPADFLAEEGLEAFLSEYTLESKFWRLCYNMRDKKVAILMCLDVLTDEYNQKVKGSKENGK